MAQRSRIRLPTQETPAWSLIHVDPPYHGHLKQTHRNYWVCALQLEAPRLQSACAQSSWPCKGRSHLKREAQRLQWRVAPFAETRVEKPSHKDPQQPLWIAAPLFQKLYLLIWGLRSTLLHCDSYAIIFTKQFYCGISEIMPLNDIAWIFSNIPDNEYYFTYFHGFLPKSLIFLFSNVDKIPSWKIQSSKLSTWRGKW